MNKKNNIPTYAYFDADRPPSGPCALLKPNSNNFILRPAAILYLAAFVAMRLEKKIIFINETIQNTANETYKLLR